MPIPVYFVIFLLYDETVSRGYCNERTGRKMVKLIAADMDGTLLNSKNRLSDGLFGLIDRLWQKKVAFCVASGRQYENVRSFFGPVADKIYFICENGTMVKYREESLYLDAIDPQGVSRMLDALSGIPTVCPVLCSADGAYIGQEHRAFLKEVELYYVRYQLTGDLQKLVRRQPVCKIAVFDEQSAQQNAYPALRPFEEEFHVVLSAPRWVDVMNNGVSKGAAIRMLQKRLGVTEMETMAFGDYLNDLELMRACHYSYAMENAHEELKQICNFRAKSNDQDGVADAIRSYFHL